MQYASTHYGSAGRRTPVHRHPCHPRPPFPHSVMVAMTRCTVAIPTTIVLRLRYVRGVRWCGRASLPTVVVIAHGVFNYLHFLELSPSEYHALMVDFIHVRQNFSSSSHERFCTIAEQKRSYFTIIIVFRNEPRRESRPIFIVIPVPLCKLFYPWSSPSPRLLTKNIFYNIIISMTVDVFVIIIIR